MSEKIASLADVKININFIINKSVLLAPFLLESGFSALSEWHQNIAKKFDAQRNNLLLILQSGAVATLIPSQPCHFAKSTKNYL
jgi:hypothetical protein